MEDNKNSCDIFIILYPTAAAAAAALNANICEGNMR